MIEQPAENAAMTSETEEIVRAALMPQMKTMFQALRASPVRSTLLMLAGGILLAIIVTAHGQTTLSQCNRPFYDALRITIDHLEVASPADWSMLEETHVQIGAGGRILIVGESSSDDPTIRRLERLKISDVRKSKRKPEPVTAG